VTYRRVCMVLGIHFSIIPFTDPDVVISVNSIFSKIKGDITPLQKDALSQVWLGIKQCFFIKKTDWLIVFCLMSLSRIVHSYEDTTIASEGLQNYYYACAYSLCAGKDRYHEKICCDPFMYWAGVNNQIHKLKW
jgi:hypothetical protein